MSTKTSVVVAGVLALVIAGSVLAVTVFTGAIIVPSANPTQNGIGSTTAPSQTSGAALAANQGTMSILLTDPPNVPYGVTKIYVTYGNLAVHVSEAGNNSGWHEVKSQGTIELMGTVNASQTLSSVKITSGNYNLIGFNISSAQVTYNGKNYTAFVQSSRLLVPIIGGIEVDASKPSATIIDISPTVFNMGSASNPEFIIRQVAKALPVPSSEVNDQMQHEGSRMDLAGKTWWRHLQQRYTANAQATSATLTMDLLAIAVKNTGNDTAALRLVMVSPLAGVLGGGQYHHVPPAFFDSAIFVVEKNGTLVPLQTFVKSLISSGGEQNAHLNNQNLMQQILKDTGFNVTAGSTASLKYNGPITFGLQLLNKNAKTNSVITGQQYIVTVIGEQSLASMVVVAG